MSTACRSRWATRRRWELEEGAVGGRSAPAETCRVLPGTVVGEEQQLLNHRGCRTEFDAMLMMMVMMMMMMVMMMMATTTTTMMMTTTIMVMIIVVMMLLMLYSTELKNHVSQTFSVLGGMGGTICGKK